jgi:hypothetical protein
LKNAPVHSARVSPSFVINFLSEKLKKIASDM